MNITITANLVDAIIAAYNNEYNSDITSSEVKSLVLSIPVSYINEKPVSWESINFDYQTK